MNVTSTGIAVTLAVIVVLGFFLFGVVNPFETPVLETETASSGAPNMQEFMTTDTVMGTGAVAKAGDTVTVKYAGRFENGQVFDASANHVETANGFTFTIGAGQVIPGWEQGVAGMKVGGTRQLVIPPDLAYGPNDYGPIPGGSTLIFDVELVSVQSGQ